MKFKQIKLLLVATLFVISSAVFNLVPVPRAAALRSIIFPVIGASSFSNDYEAARDSGPHHAIDIIAKKGQKLVSVIDGTITRVNYPQPSWGYSVTVRDTTGYRYNYLHINDDNPGTNDGRGGGMHAYAADMKVGNPIVKGQLIGWVGDSGHSNGVSHLHFEMINPDGQVVNPYNSLVQAKRISAPRDYPTLPNEVLPYGRTFNGGANVAAGNLDGDLATEYAVSSGPGGIPKVHVYDDNNALIGNFYAYDSSYHRGFDVAMGNVDGDSADEIIVGAGPGGSPRVKIYELDGTLKTSFLVYADNVDSAIHVAAGDVDNDGTDEIIVGAGAGPSHNVKVFEPDGTLVTSFIDYGLQMKSGVYVAAGDVSGSPNAEIITTTGIGGSTQVRIFDSVGTPLTNFSPYPDYDAGIIADVGNVITNTAKAEILTIPTVKAPPYMKLYDGNGQAIRGTMYLEEWWRGYYDLAAGYGVSRVTTGVNRRTSLRAGLN